MERRSAEENSDGQEMMDFSSFPSLRRYDNLEDISQIGTAPSSQPPPPQPEDEEAMIYQVATEAAGKAIAAAIQEHQRLAKIHEDENGNPPSPSDDAPFPSCTSQAQPAATSSSGPVTSASGMSGRMQMVTSSGMGGNAGAEEEARSQRKALEAHISDEISKITQGMQDIVRRGAADIKPIPPPKPRRRLPEPIPEMMTAAAFATAAGISAPTGPASAPQAVSPSLRRSKAGGPSKGVRIVEQVDDTAHTARISPIFMRSGDVSHPREGPAPGSAAGGSTPASVSDSEASSIPRQDSAEKRKAKDLKAKPSPLLIQHIEAEEQSVSPHYRVMDSPPTPEHKLIKREFSESTSVSPSSSPDMDQYMFPSPVTPPDSDSSPPKPHSPSSAGTDFDEDTLQCGSAGDVHLTGDVSLDVDIAARSYDPFSERAGAVDFGQVEAKPSRKRAPPPVPVRSRASGAGGGVEGPRALPPPPARSESVESEGGSEEGEASASVRDKIRAFEQVSYLPIPPLSASSVDFASVSSTLHTSLC